MRKKAKLLATIATAAALAMASAVTSLANTGWINVQTKWYYYDATGNSIRNQWVQDGDNLFWLKDNGEMAIQTWVNYDNSWFWVNAQGGMVKDCWIPIEKDWYYIGQDGKMLANTWLNYGHKTYYLTESGATARGWKEINDNWYYFDLNNGDMAKGTTIGSYKVDENGIYIQ